MYVHVQYYHRAKIFKEIWIFVLIHSTVSEIITTNNFIIISFIHT